MAEIAGGAAVASALLGTSEKIVDLIRGIINQCDKHKNFQLLQKSYLVKATKIKKIGLANYLVVAVICQKSVFL